MIGFILGHLDQRLIVGKREHDESLLAVAGEDVVLGLEDRRLLASDVVGNDRCPGNTEIAIPVRRRR